MKAIVIDQYGDADGMRLADMPVPEPGPGEVRIRVAAAGVNFIDVYMRRGVYARSATYANTLPMTLGMEGAGVVDALGPGVGGLAPGDVVAWCLSRGSYADFAVVPAWRVVRVPDGVPAATAAALMLQGCTAHYLTRSAFPLGPGSTAFVHAAAGGVGQLLVQLAKRAGATVIASVGSAEKAEIARGHGADHVVLYREEDFLERVREITGGRGADVVYDSIGRDTIARSIRAVRRRGLCVLFGASSGPVPSIEPIELAEAGSVFFTRPHLADYMATAEEIAGRAADLFDAVAGGGLRVAIDQVFPLADAAEAHRHLEAGRTRGKLLLGVA
jgi:NADPH2:quinone reductase